MNFTNRLQIKWQLPKNMQFLFEWIKKCQGWQSIKLRLICAKRFRFLMRSASFLLRSIFHSYCSCGSRNSQRGRQSQRGVAPIYYLVKYLFTAAWKWKKLDPSICCHLRSLEISRISMSTIQRKVWSWVITSSADVQGFELCFQECIGHASDSWTFIFWVAVAFDIYTNMVPRKALIFSIKPYFFHWCFFNKNCNFDKLKIIGLIIGLIGSITKVIQ